MNNVLWKVDEVKETNVITPEWMAKEIWGRMNEIIQRNNFRKSITIADFCCGKGALTSNIDIDGYDIVDYSQDYPGNFIQCDLLSAFDAKKIGYYEIILMNPPFNGNRGINIMEQFLDVALFHLKDKGFIVMIALYNFFMDGVKRWGRLNKSITIFKLLPFPVHTTFEGFHLHGGILFICQKKDINLYQEFYEIKFLTI